MLLVDRLVEEQVQAAIRRGEFDDLPGQGAPLILDDDQAMPEELRVAYRILKNAGCLPPELKLRNEIRELESLLIQIETAEELSSIRRRLCLLHARLAIHGRSADLLLQEKAYREKLIGRLARENNDNSRVWR